MEKPLVDRVEALENGYATLQSKFRAALAELELSGVALGAIAKVPVGRWAERTAQEQLDEVKRIAREALGWK